MPLDPLAKGLLDQLAAVPAPRLWEGTLEQGRQLFANMLGLMGPRDVPIGSIENMAVPGPAGDVPLRIYTPVASGSELLPALIYFHGGGFVLGDLDTHDGLCRLFANEGGFRIIAVDYRLAPEHKFPAAVDDAYAAACWIEANAARLGVDANRLAVGGDSAGATLAAIVAQLAKAKAGPHLVFQMLLFPMSQAVRESSSLREFGAGYLLDREAMLWFAENYLPPDTDRTDPRVSPLLAENVTGLPPAYVMLGGFDPLHDDGLQYAHKLRDAGVSVAIAEYSDMIHCFHYFQSVLPQAREAVTAASKAAATALTKR